MSPEQCRAARALLGISRPQLSVIAQVGKNTVQAFEAGSHRTTSTTVRKLRAAFASLSIRFIDDGHGVGVQRGLTMSEIESLERFVDRPPVEPPRSSSVPNGAAISPSQSRAARAFLDMSQSEAANRADVGLSLLVAFETGLRAPRLGNARKIKSMYEAMGIVFTEINGIPAVRANPRRDDRAHSLLMRGQQIKQKEQSREKAI